MNILGRRLLFLFSYITVSTGTWTASEWWEKGLATKENQVIISPNKCYRIESYTPAWLLPTWLHPWGTPDKVEKPQWFVQWIAPGFDRLYDHRTNAFLGESEVYDFGRTGGGGTFWGDRLRPGVYEGMIYIGPNAPDCIGDLPTQLTPEE
ncbi:MULTISPECIES: hypothetical protein [Pseudomonas syringae group]|uniref:hypothetical protein n=1 Tax=Pseudomonas syringae group TaxID=136849 RepID=UPI0009B4D455|nr:MULTISPECIES: hypothetical protein [Pseudomonas syringae group]POQ09412.1 hypothetical protein CXB40_04540 [Pseudomonas syringae pv. avii]